MRATGRKGRAKELMQGNGNESERKVMVDGIPKEKLRTKRPFDIEGCN